MTSLQATAEVQQELPDTLLVNVGDSEADLFALFRKAEELQAHFLIRACRDRLIEGEQENHLWKNLENQAAIGTLEVAVPRQGDRSARTTVLSIRLVQVNLKAPRREAKNGLASVTGWAILAREETIPPEGERIEWRLITNVPTLNRDQACERVSWYSCRWVVEMFHKVLKSGCRIEERQFDDFENTKRFLGLDSVVAWRVLFLTLTGRETPDMNCEALFEAYEWQSLYCFIHKTNQPPEKAPTLGEMNSLDCPIGWLYRK